MGNLGAACGCPVVLDWGRADLPDELGNRAGTPWYKVPEQPRGDRMLNTINT